MLTGSDLHVVGMRSVMCVSAYVCQSSMDEERNVCVCMSVCVSLCKYVC